MKEKELDIRNSERYLDTTAFNALKNAPKKGEVWVYETKGAQKQALVINKRGRICNILVLTEEDGEDTIPVKSKALMYTNPAMLQYAYIDQMTVFVRKLSDTEFIEVLKDIERVIGFQMVSTSKAVPEYTKLKAEFIRVNEQLQVYKTLYNDLLAQVTGSDSNG